MTDHERVSRSINLQPVWAPGTRSRVFTSFMNGYPAPAVG
jgi:hypothetical protein